MRDTKSGNNTRTANLNADCMLMTLSELVLPLYDINRSSLVPFSRDRHENDAEHSFSLGLVAMCIAPMIDAKLDLGLISQYALIHDLVEVYAGDTSVYADATRRASKASRERAALKKVRIRFRSKFPWLIERLDEYSMRLTPESNFVYAVDKLLPHAMVLIADYHHVRPDWSTYKRTESVAKKKIATTYPSLSAVFDDLCHRYALRPHLFSTPPDPEAVRVATISSANESYGNLPVSAGDHDCCIGQ